MLDKTGMNPRDVRAEIHRYLVQPGQASSYKMGHLKMLELREDAKTRLGDRFDVRAFHDVVLGNGALPLLVLEQVVDEWVASVEATAASPTPGLQGMEFVVGADGNLVMRSPQKEYVFTAATL